ncbi:hypothetical protein [Tepidiforma sp.]|jgi:hypothetical protein|uniref:hypothetical protein n=1 Tax=Tepidiforma sp. TaxID=2682230 RepID=UPI00261BF501|nr:hypothetical protein [Tepidiforma sp.]MCX7618463.1 hypothetical protein [Tepidiforma sp.]
MRSHILTTRTVPAAALAASMLLLIPFGAMLVTDAVRWGFLDFAAAWLLVFATGAGISAAARARSMPLLGRLAAAAAIAALVAVAWGELAVGLFGSPFAGT